MRKITELSAQAFKDGTPFKMANMKVMGDINNTIMTLHDNVIATREGDKLLLTHSGWKTNTTKERLNGVLAAFDSEWRIYQKAGVWYITDGMGKQKEFNGLMEFEV